MTNFPFLYKKSSKKSKQSCLIVSDLLSFDPIETLLLLVCSTPSSAHTCYCDLDKDIYTSLALIILGTVMLIVVRVKHIEITSFLSTHFSLAYTEVIFVATVKSQLFSYSSNMKNLHTLCFQPIMRCK